MKSFYKYLIPSIIATLIVSSYVMVDGIFIGQKIGDLGLAAINIAWPITAILQGLGTALGLSFGVCYQTYLGHNDEVKAKRIKSTALILMIITSIVLGIILFIFAKPLLTLFGAKDLTLDYGYRYIKIILYGSLFQLLGCAFIPMLKNSGKVKFAMSAQILALSINFIFDYLFIMVLNLELEGARLASIMGEASAAIFSLIVYLKELKKPYFSKDFIKEFYISSLAPFVLNYSYSFIIILTNYLCLKYGGSEACRAYTLLSYLLYIISALSTSVADAIQPLFSYNNAIRDYKNNHKMLLKCILISFILVSIFSLLFLLLKDQLAKLYNLSDFAEEYYINGLRYYLFGFILVSIIRVICSYLYSINDKLRSNFLVIVEPIILTPIIYSIMGLNLKLDGIWMSYLIIQGILLIISSLLLYLNIRGEQ